MNAVPLIIVRDVLSPNGLELPPEFEKREGCRVAGYFISLVRKTKLNGKTPIIVPYSINDSVTPIRTYTDAGATACLNLSSSTLEDAVASLISYLSKKA